MAIARAATPCSSIEGQASRKTARYPFPMCELICSAWYPEKVSGHVPAMPVVEVMPQSHREREVLALAAASDADSEPEMPPEESTVRLRGEARSFELQLH